MEKKHIIISLGIIIFMVIVILIYNLVVKKNAQNNTTDPTNMNTPIVVPTTTTGTVLCTRIKHGDKETIKFEASNNTLNKSTFKFTKDPIEFGFENTNNLNYENKLYIQNDILKNLGLNSLYENGITVSIEYTDEVVIYIAIDYNVATDAQIKNLGINFERTNFSSTIKQLVESREYICE
ncbi:MAG: hypothetical protein IJK67_02090 [Bacilli bacterium]|nr:hypothetical protein [Bacilli bacterium]